MFQATEDPNVILDTQTGTYIPRGNSLWPEDESVIQSQPAVALSDVQEVLCNQIDATADAAYEAIGGASPGRLAEYKQAKADADAFKAAGYAGTVPDTVACWAEAKGWTDQQACDDILATATNWEAILYAIRRQRLVGKANVRAADDEATSRSCADTTKQAILAIAAGAA